MPPFFIVLHLLLCAACFLIARRITGRSRAGAAFTAFVAALVVAGFVLERREDWSWAAMALRFPDLVFLTNISLEGTAVLTVVLWRAAQGRGARIRACVLSALLTGVSLWSYSWYFLPLPAGLHGMVDARGYCRQTTPDSCSAAAAVMLLHSYNVETTEAEMTDLCLTRAEMGTPPLGLYRGLAVKAGKRGLWPRMQYIGKPSGLHALGGPCIISVGLDRNCPDEIAVKMEGFGWQTGVWHTVVVLNADPKGAWLDVADPSYGREKWPVGDITCLWDGRALILARR